MSTPRPGTVWIWLVVATHAASTVLAIPILARMADLMPRLIASSVAADAASSAPGARNSDGWPLMAGAFSETMDFLAMVFGLSLIGLLLTAAAIVFGWLDWRELRRRGVSRPFHWAWGFFALANSGVLVYVIGRSVIIRRRVRADWAPMWVIIAITVVATIGALVWTGVVVSGAVQTALLETLTSPSAALVSAR